MSDQEANPSAAMLVIGDEILSGRTRDANTHYLAGALAAHGISLAEARVVSDSCAAIVDAVRALSKSYTHVFTSGGIGPTHDDITAESVAKAFDVGIGIRDDARQILAAHCDRKGIELNAARLRMARIPDGASLIPNSVSAAPGFTLGNVHVMAGVPSIFQAMLGALLPGLGRGLPVVSRSVTVNKPEGEIAADLTELAAAFPDLSFGSYPIQDTNGFRVNLVVRGTDGGRVDTAFAQLGALFADTVA